MSTSKYSSKALQYHAVPTPGKIAMQTTKPTETQDDLSLAYTPGVAEPVLEIAKDKNKAYEFTSKGNLVGVITNGSAILGLGNLGALASKPVMEGKAALFKRFADIDVFDIEVDCSDVNDFIKTVENISPTFGGINLEDIKAPDCFIIEDALKAKLDIPVFHDDQHGTAISIAAGLINSLEIQNKKLADVKITCIGAGAAGIASMKFLVQLGAKKENILLTDSKGVIRSDRNDLNEYKRMFAQNTTKRSQTDAIAGSDVLIGLAGANIVSSKELLSMNANPIIFTLSNPDPEIAYEIALATRTDAIIATGRSDHPNQINNLLCFPYIFRGTLDAHAKQITFNMMKAATFAIADLAKKEVPTEVRKLYKNTSCWTFGKEYILPKPIDFRLKDKVSNAVAAAAISELVTV
jgi:malate dehydrogenase (oxaloacetate-decarboxylating)(NADP+)